MIGVLGILASLVLLIILAYRNFSVIAFAPICVLLAVALDGQTPILASYTQVYMPSLALFISRYFPLFLLGAIFGKLMEDSGSAAKIASILVGWLGPRQAILTIVISCGILTYGGVSLFVVVFAVFPFARSLFQQANLPKRLIPGTIALGSFTFTMTAMPGSIQIQNMIPMPYFKTTSFAAPGWGLAASAIMLALGMTWMNHRARQAFLSGEGYGEELPTQTTETPAGNMPSALAAFLPVFSVVVLNFLFSYFIIPQWNTSYLAEPRFGATDASRVTGIWSGILAMACAVGLTIFLQHGRLANPNKSICDGAAQSLLPIFNTASEFGYGTSIAMLSGFTSVKKFIMGISPDNPLISEAISVNALAAITGSASGGLSIALESLGATYYETGIAKGINPELLHRIASLSSGGLDTLPHNGAVITLLVICGMTHRQSYKDIFVVSVLVPVIATATVLLLAH